VARHRDDDNRPGVSIDLRLAPTAMVAGGAALARDETGRVVFVEGAMPGEIVRAVVTEAHPDFARATIAEVLEPSPDRVFPPCPAVAAGCGGCSWQHIAPAAQERFYPGAAEVLLRVGVASGERLARISPPEAATRVQVPPGVVVIGEGTTEAWVHETVAGRRFRVSADSFFQPGPEAAAALAAAVVAAVADPTAPGDGPPPGGHVVDAYAGVGLFAALLAARLGVGVTAIESSRSAVADARVNLADVDGRVMALDVRRWRKRRSDATVDAVVADPPRSGLGREGVAALATACAPRLVLVSCDPASLGRDTQLLGQAGYRLVSVAIVDAFPHTFHVETVSRFDGPGGSR
jgi:tRNA/tmRNA/rRNA uracil-C5-methylase (TrmA/RlmC/RlmD family)